jgi:hypothetical protein
LQQLRHIQQHNHAQPKPQTFDGGAYQISEHTTFLSGGAEFVEFAIVRTGDGGPLVANGSTNANTFQIWLNNIQLTSSALESTPYFDFATNGTANTGIKAGGILTVGPNPNPGSIGFGQNSFFQPGKVFLTGVPGTTAAYTFFTSSDLKLAGPFDTVAANRNFDPNATEFFFGFELTPAPGPIPGAGLLSYITLGLLGLGSLGWKRLRPA